MLWLLKKLEYHNIQPNTALTLKRGLLSPAPHLLIVYNLSHEKTKNFDFSEFLLFSPIILTFLCTQSYSKHFPHKIFPLIINCCHEHIFLINSIEHIILFYMKKMIWTGYSKHFFNRWTHPGIICQPVDSFQYLSCASVTQYPFYLF